MKIDVWSDIACPFCYIGKKTLEKALQSFPDRGDLEITFRSFELDPGAPVERELTVVQMLAKRYRVSEERARQMNQGVAQRGAEVGIHFDFDELKLTTTFDAHRLLHWAKGLGKQSELKDRLLSAYFSEGMNVGKHEVLVQKAVQVGLPESEARQVLQSNQYSAEVEFDKRQAEEFGLNGVPAFVIADKYLVSGAQPAEVLLEALQQAWKVSG
jgi:predicted DsbA family dithiol-disulfide isomerase